MRKLLFAALFVFCAELGCGKSLSFEEIDKANAAVVADVKSEIGREALMGYEQDGSRSKVTVTLVATSLADAVQAEPKIEAIVRRHYPKASEVLVKAQPE
jgi:archaellum component FlaF (FlaF/FlaG flagellin family)